MIEKSEALEKLYYEYTHLPLDGKRIRCPYWSNRQRILLSGPFKGKGTPSQIIRATLKTVKKYQIDLQKLSADQIRKFMEHHRIGVDCSGFVYHLLDALDKERGGKGIEDFVEGVKGKGERRINAYCLTNDKNSVEIKNLKEIKIGDLIRLNNGKHVAVILRIKKDNNSAPQEIIYVHSCNLTAITGVHTARILVTKPASGIEKQKWLEKTRKGDDFRGKYFLKQEGDGIRRLKIWA